MGVSFYFENDGSSLKKTRTELTANSGSASTEGDVALIQGGNPTGTWRCLGPTRLDKGISNGGTISHHVGLWVRTA